MAGIRCQLVVTDNSEVQQAGAVSAAIGALSGFSVVRAAPGESAADIVLWITTASAIDSTARMIAAARGRTPGSPIVVAAPEADLAALSLLLAADRKSVV